MADGGGRGWMEAAVADSSYRGGWRRAAVADGTALLSDGGNSGRVASADGVACGG